MLSMLLLFALQAPEPRFVMTPEPDDRYAAALFELEPGADHGSLVAALMGRGPDAIPRPEGNDPGKAFIFAAVGSSDRRDRICRIARTSAGQTDNLRRAMAWCATFIVPGAGPTVTVPPMTPPAN